MARIGIDLDGVCYDFSGAVWRYVDSLHESSPLRPPNFPAFHGESRRWAFYEDWGWSLDEFLHAVDCGVDAGVIFDGPMRPGVAEAFTDLFDGGHTIHIVTDRRSGSGDNAKRNTFAWLERHGLGPDTVTFSADKTSVECDYFIEDKIENYDALDAAGVEVWLVDRPWNQVEGGDNRRRCDGIRHFAEIIFAQEQAERDEAAWLARTLTETTALTATTGATTEIRPEDYVFTGEVRTVSSTGGEKGVKLARFDLIPSEFLWALAEHFGVGAQKYDDDNWRRGYEWWKSYGAMQRHLHSWLMGEDIDAETGSNHLIAVAWHACVLFWFAANHPEFDTRHKAA